MPHVHRDQIMASVTQVGGVSQPLSSSSSGGRYNNAYRYVTTLLAFDGSFGGRIVGFAAEWSKLTPIPGFCQLCPRTRTTEFHLGTRPMYDPAKR